MWKDYHHHHHTMDKSIGAPIHTSTNSPARGNLWCLLYVGWAVIYLCYCLLCELCRSWFPFPGSRTMIVPLTCEGLPDGMVSLEAVNMSALVHWLSIHYYHSPGGKQSTFLFPITTAWIRSELSWRTREGRPSCVSCGHIWDESCLPCFIIFEKKLSPLLYHIWEVVTFALSYLRSFNPCFIIFVQKVSPLALWYLYVNSSPVPSSFVLAFVSRTRHHVIYCAVYDSACLPAHCRDICEFVIGHVILWENKISSHWLSFILKRQTKVITLRHCHNDIGMPV